MPSTTPYVCQRFTDHLFPSLPQEPVTRTSTSLDKMSLEQAGGFRKTAAGLKFVYGVVNFVLSLVNAINYGFKFDEFTGFIFSASAVMEGFGVLFALYRTDWRGLVLGANPLSTVWKSKDYSSRFEAVFLGFAVQASALWACFVVYLFVSGIGDPWLPGTFFVSSTVVVGKVICAAQPLDTPTSPEEPQRDGSGPSSQGGSCSVYAYGHVLLKFVALLAPAALELVEGVLLVSKLESDQALVQAVWDFIAKVLCNEWGSMLQSAENYHGRRAAT